MQQADTSRLERPIRPFQRSAERYYIGYKAAPVAGQFDDCGQQLIGDVPLEARSGKLRNDPVARLTSCRILEEISDTGALIDQPV